MPGFRDGACRYSDCRSGLYKDLVASMQGARRAGALRARFVEGSQCLLRWPEEAGWAGTIEGVWLRDERAKLAEKH
jgi:hypothetical protein